MAQNSHIPVPNSRRSKCLKMSSVILKVTVGLCVLSISAGQTVFTKSGRLSGRTEKSREGLEYYSFRGIPYAEKPERFAIAQPVKPWDGTRDAINLGSKCLQPLGGGSEDCLTLNVYTPSESRCQNASSNGKLPVLFHIHGGGFIIGSGGENGPKFLMDECIVYVNNNYRLGAFGFLTTGDEVIPGNLGLKDSLLALKWIHENIGYFRGDNGSITLNGISAGGGSVSHFLASPAAAGLCHRVIAQSGSALSPWAVVKNPKENAFNLGRLLNCSSDTTTELAACLKNVPAEHIVEAQIKLAPWRYSLPPFRPVVESLDAIEPFQNEAPYARWRRGDVHKVPLIAGSMRDDGVNLFAGGKTNSGVQLKTINPLDKAALQELNEKWTDIAPIYYFFDDLNVTREVRDNISSSIRNFYLDGKDAGNETAAGFVNSNTDRYFAFGAYEEAKLHSKVAPVYNYLFSFIGLNSTAAGHGDDAIYLFAGDDTPVRELGPRAKDFSQQLVKLWVSFIRDGKPDATTMNITSWEPFTADDKNTLRLDMPAQVLKSVNSDRMGFWESLKLRQLEFPDIA